MANVADFRKPLGDFKIPKRIIHCRPDTPCVDVLEAMKLKDLGAVVVTSEERDVLGIVTERDFMNKVVGIAFDLEKSTVDQIMTANPTTVKISDSLIDVIKIMQLGNFRRMIVTEDNGKLAYVISYGDIIAIIVGIINNRGL